jgi:hypothetical protein
MYRYAPPGQMSWYSVKLPGEGDVQSDLGLSVVVNIPSWCKLCQEKSVAVDHESPSGMPPGMSYNYC